MLDEYDAIAGYYKGWPLSDIRSLSPREREEWIHRAIEHSNARRAMRGE